MTKIFRSFKKILPFFLFLCVLEANAQQKVNSQTAFTLVQQNASLLGVSPADLLNTRISDAYFDKLSGSTLVYLQQTYQDIDVYNAIQTLAFKNDKIISVAGKALKNLAQRANIKNAVPLVAAPTAVKSASQHLVLSAPQSFTALRETPDKKETEFGSLGISKQNIKAKLLWVPIANSEQMKLCWQVQIQPVNTQDYWLVKVDATNGTVIGKDNLTVNDNWNKPNGNIAGYFQQNKLDNKTANTMSVTDVTTASYLVVPYPAEAPSFPGGTPSVQIDPWLLAPAGSPATTLKWNDDGTNVYEYSKGNNVLAQEDHDGNDGNGKRALSSTAAPSLTFNYAPNFTKKPTDSLNQGFALTNLFYWNNIMHDISYLYGFDEVSGNFQANNLGRGGEENDYVLADGQDGGGSDNANFGTPPDGQNPRMQMYLFTSANPKLDGDLDAGVMCHEYTHGISNRLTGGPSNVTCLQNVEQMGEGWSDYVALMTTTNWATAQISDGVNPRPLGTYVENQSTNGSGIRNYPYSTDINVDPWTYDQLATLPFYSFIGGPDPHAVGEIWCTTLWDLTWELIQMDGINPNLYDVNATGGNSVALKLVLEGMKLQACSPGFVDGRDGILKADTLLYGGKYSCLIWKVFARRGIGEFASQGSSSDYQDQKADFHVKTLISFVKHADKADAAQGELITYTIRAEAASCAAVTDAAIVDTLASNVTYVSSNGVYNATNRTVTFSGINIDVNQTQDYTITVQVNNGTYFTTIKQFDDSVTNSSLSPAWENVSTTDKSWNVTNTRSHSSPNSYFIDDLHPLSDASLQTTATFPLQGVSLFSFWHYYDVQLGNDGGVVEISTDSGANWQDLGSYMIQNGYQGSVESAANPTLPLAGRKVFNGMSNGFVKTIINLTSFAGKNVMIRFRFATNDGQLDFDGWYIDDISLKSEAGVYNTAQLFDENAQLQITSDALTTINDIILPVVWGNFTAEKQGKGTLLKWSTLQEQNTADYIIERSADGSHFNAIGSVTAAGTSTTTSYYQYQDAAPMQGINFYRLKQVDKDNRYVYSALRSVVFNVSLTQLITIAPNPAKDKINITVTGNTKALQVYLLNTQGQRLKQFTMNGESLPLNLPDLPAGVYYIKIVGDGINSNHKLVIQ